jgi:two-component system, chemotaxis family, protein-glutamate methylesterase/glutaminase
MRAARIFIVDDSAVTRRVLREALASDALMEVIGVAPDGETALKRIEECRPDIVTLDVELPGISGLQALKQIRRRWPRLSMTNVVDV